MNTSSFSRRGLLMGSAAAAAAAALPRMGVAAEPVSLKPGGIVLFQGDSITDAGRDRRTQDQPNNQSMLGHGYPLFISGYLLASQPQLAIKTYNRGISGNKVPDLDARWQADCLDLKPDVLSILIGVNDIWHKLNGNSTGTPADYDRQLAALLARTKEAMPQTRIVICEPFVLKCGSVTDKWFPEFDERRAIARKNAEAAGAIFVPFQEMFDQAVAGGTEPAYWGADGVHPSMAGHMLMAMAWVRTVLGE